MTNDRTWVVTYQEVDLHLTYAEYDGLTRAAIDDPPAAKQMADGFLARESTPSRPSRHMSPDLAD